MMIDCTEDEILLIDQWRIYGADDVSDEDITDGAKERRKILRNLIQKEDVSDH